MTWFNNVFWKLVFYLNNSQLNLILILIVFLCKSIKTENNNNLSCLFLFLIIFNQNYINNVLQDYLNNYHINKELYNGLLVIHPILTYITMVWYTNIKNVNKNILKQSINFLRLSRLNQIFKKLILICSISMFLGSLWAQQELNWGGWWNWDSVEVILLCFNLLLLVLIHINNSKRLNIYINNFYIEKYIYIVLFYLVVRSNLITSVHAFSVSIQIQKYFYAIILLLMLFYVFYYMNFFYKNKFKNLFLKNFSKKFFRKNKNISNMFYNINMFIFIITIINIYLFIKNIKLNISVYKYVGIFIKIYVLSVFLFSLKQKHINTSILLLICLSFYNVSYVVVLLLVTLLQQSFSKIIINFITILHNFFLLIGLLLISDYYLTIQKLDFFTNNTSLIVYTYNNFIEVFSVFFSNLKNEFLLKNNINLLLDNYLTLIIESGINLNFLNSNLINFNNKFIINYILDNTFLFNMDYHLVQICFFLIYVYIIVFFINNPRWFLKMV